MLNIQKIPQKYGGFLCRHCMNREFRVLLTRNDCFYGYPEAHICPLCGEYQNIVTGLRLSGHTKLLFHRPASQ